MAPQCRGMLGGDQSFYWHLGFKVETINESKKVCKIYSIPFLL